MVSDYKKPETQRAGTYMTQLSKTYADYTEGNLGVPAAALDPPEVAATSLPPLARR